MVLYKTGLIDTNNLLLFDKISLKAVFEAGRKTEYHFSWIYFMREGRGGMSTIAIRFAALLFQLPF